MFKTAPEIRGGACIAAVTVGSIAEEVGLAPGDSILNINGMTPDDIISYRVLSYSEDVELEIIKEDGEPWFVEIEKEDGEPLGVSFAPSTISPVRTCSNNCMFCFVQQNPAGMRETVNFRDDDYRLSFLEGNYITLNNVSDEDLKRIAVNGISPLYVSVHTTDKRLRKKMMKHKEAGLIMDKLRYLTEKGVHIHGQVVVCPGWNDGIALKKTVKNLADLGPNMESLAVVPVGLTKHRKKLEKLKPLNKKDALKTLTFIHSFQEKMLKERGSRFLFPSDEYYIAAGETVPSEEAYEDYPQLANGVGLLRLFMDEYEELVNSERHLVFARALSVTVATSEAAKDYIAKAVDFLNKIENLKVDMKVIPSVFFGGHVTVAGLLTGKDILEELADKDNGSIIFIPRVTLKEEEDIFLDGMTLEEVSRALNTPVSPVSSLQELTDFLEAAGEDNNG